MDTCTFFKHALNSIIMTDLFLTKAIVVQVTAMPAPTMLKSFINKKLVAYPAFVFISPYSKRCYSVTLKPLNPQNVMQHVKTRLFSLFNLLENKIFHAN